MVAGRDPAVAASVYWYGGNLQHRLIQMYKGNTTACGLGTEILIGTPDSLKSLILKSHLYRLSVKGNSIAIVPCLC